MKEVNSGFVTILAVTAAIFLVPHTSLMVVSGAVPGSSELEFRYFSDETAEFAQFELGHLDLTDSPVPVAKYAQYDATPDFTMSGAQGEFAMYQIDINHQSSHFAAWGCPFDGGNSVCGVEIRQGIAHLVDRPQFVLNGPIQGAGEAIVDPTPPAMTPSGSSLPTQNSWDTLNGQTVAGHAHGNTNGAFNIAPDSGGFATIRAGVPDPDLCAARDHFIRASQVEGWSGPAFEDANVDCVIDNPIVAVANPIRYMIRSDDPRLRALGTGHMNAINTLFGTDVVAETFGNIAQLGSIIFVTGTTPAPAQDDWEMYTGYWPVRGPFSDHLRPLYSSGFASDFCGGTPNQEPLNYAMVCVPDFDLHVDAAAQTDSIPAFIDETVAALDEFGRRALNIPAYSMGIRTVALRDVAGLVNQRGVGYPNFWSVLDGRANPAYTPTNAIYTFGGGTNTLRWGQKQGTSTLNIFHARTPWDFNALGAIYDALVRPAPTEPEKTISWMASKYELNIDDTGNTHIIFDLRDTLRWHDGQPVTAEDVRFSILNYRDVPAATLAGAVGHVIDVVVLAPARVELILQGKSVSHLLNMGVPIIPKHLWDTDNNDIADPDKTADDFDPMTAGMLIGSGPFVCRSVFDAQATVGRGCHRTAAGSEGGHVTGPGSSVLLRAFDRTAELGPLVRYFLTVPPIGEVSVTGIGLSRDFAYNGVPSNPIQVSLTLTSQGFFAVTFSATGATVNTIGLSGIVAAGVTIVSLNWNANLLPTGIYTISANAPALPEEVNLGDNAFTYGVFTVRFKADVNNDCVVNIIDLASEGAAFGSVVGPPASANWNSNADLNNDGVVNIVDLATVGASFGQVCP